MATSAATVPISSRALAERSHLLRNRVYGVVFILIALLMYLLFARGVGASSVSTFGLNQGTANEGTRLADLVVPSAGTVLLLAVTSAAVGAYQLARGFGRSTSVLLGLIVV